MTLWIVTDLQVIPSYPNIWITATTDLPAHLSLTASPTKPHQRPRTKYRRGVQVDCGYYLSWGNHACYDQAEAGATTQHSWLIPFDYLTAEARASIGEACPPTQGTPSTVPFPLLPFENPCNARPVLDTFNRGSNLSGQLAALGTSDSGHLWLQGADQNALALPVINEEVHGLQTNRAIMYTLPLGTYTDPPAPLQDYLPPVLAHDFCSTDAYCEINFADHTCVCPNRPLDNGTLASAASHDNFCGFMVLRMDPFQQSWVEAVWRRRPAVPPLPLLREYRINERAGPFIIASSTATATTPTAGWLRFEAQGNQLRLRTGTPGSWTTVLTRTSTYNQGETQAGFWLSNIGFAADEIHIGPL